MNSRQDDQQRPPGETLDVIVELLWTIWFLSDVLSVEESILIQVIRLAKREPAESIKLPGQYFNFFTNYATGGRYEVSVDRMSSGH